MYNFRKKSNFVQTNDNLSPATKTGPLKLRRKRELNAKLIDSAFSMEN